MERCKKLLERLEKLEAEKCSPEEKKARIAKFKKANPDMTDADAEEMLKNVKE